MNTEAEKVLQDIIGRKAWGVKLGHGSFLILEFGNPVSAEDSVSQSEWHLWVYFCSWRIERDGCFLVACEDERTKIESVVKEMENQTLMDFDVSHPSLDATLKFENGIVLKTFAILSEDEDGHGQHWMLFLPEHKVLVAGPGSHFEIEKSNE